MVMRDIYRQEMFRFTFEFIVREILQLKTDEELVAFFNLVMHYLYSASEKRHAEAENIIIELKEKGDKIIEDFEIPMIMKITKLQEDEVKILIALYNKFKEKALDHIDIIDGKITMK